jgi:FAD/FMN-containing dehydrogenase
VLEWEVITANGQLLTASPTQNLNLYWALSGGGGGTYGVVVSMTVKVHPQESAVAAGMCFAIPSTSTGTDDF